MNERRMLSTTLALAALYGPVSMFNNVLEIKASPRYGIQFHTSLDDQRLPFPKSRRRKIKGFQRKQGRL